MILLKLKKATDKNNHPPAKYLGFGRIGEEIVLSSERSEAISFYSVTLDGSAWEMRDNTTCFLKMVDSNFLNEKFETEFDLNNEFLWLVYNSKKDEISLTHVQEDATLFKFQRFGDYFQIQGLGTGRQIRERSLDRAQNGLLGIGDTRKWNIVFEEDEIRREEEERIIHCWSSSLKFFVISLIIFFIVTLLCCFAWKNWIPSMSEFPGFKQTQVVTNVSEREIGISNQLLANSEIDSDLKDYFMW